MSNKVGKVAEDSARGSFFLISGTASATVILAVASILIGRILGPELYGQYTLAFVVPQLLFLFTDLGIDRGIIKYTASLRTEGEVFRLARMIQNGILIKVVTGLVIFAAGYFLADWSAQYFLQRPELAFYVRIASIGIIFQVIFTTAISAFVGLDKTEYHAFTTNVQAIAKTVISIALVLLGFSITGAIVGGVVSYMTAAIVGVLVLFVIIKNNDSKASRRLGDDFRTLISYGTPLYISSILTGFVPLFQNLMLALFASDVEVGNFKAAINFTSLISVMSVPITTALLPAFSKLGSSASQEIRSFFRLANKYTSMLIIPFSVLMIIYSTIIVQTVYGSTYESAPLFLSIYCLLYFLVGFGSFTLTSLFNGLGKTKVSMVMGLITFVLIMTLSPVVTKVYGVPGLITAYLIGSTAGTLFGLHAARRQFHIKLGTVALLKVYVISILAAFPSFLMLRFVSLPVIINLVVGGFLYLIIYATLAPLTRSVSTAELQIVLQITQRIPLLKLVAPPILSYEQRLLKVSQKSQ